MRVATFNVESFFERPKVLNTDSWSVGKPALQPWTRERPSSLNAHYLGRLADLADPPYVRIAPEPVVPRRSAFKSQGE